MLRLDTPRWNRLVLRLTAPREGKPNRVERAAAGFVDVVNRGLLKPIGTALKVLATVLFVLAGAYMCTSDDLECWLNGREYMTARGAACPATYWWEGLLPQP